MSIRISQLKDYSISVDQARYATSIFAKYLDTDWDDKLWQTVADDLTEWLIKGGFM